MGTLQKGTQEKGNIAKSQQRKRENAPRLMIILLCAESLGSVALFKNVRFFKQ